MAHASDAATGRYYLRFDTTQRITHVFLMVSFVGLALTGLPLRFADQAWAAGLARALGGFEAAGLIHRACAIVMIVVFVSHVGRIVKRVYLNRDLGMLWGPDSLVPQPRDVVEMYHHFRWFVGLGPRPKFDRFTYWEKFDFWSLAGGTFIIAATGFMMWFPVQTAKLLPGIFLNIALVIHSNEALLAVGVIFIFVHLFSAHLKPGSFPLDKVIFDGSLPFREYAHERPLEYERRIREGTLRQVLVAKETDTGRAKAATGLWWVITIVMLGCAAGFGVFFAWATLTWVGLL